ncbi:MAG TPA: potassium transporter [Verrucomicrobia bacterium]|nr:potassium transporter [Kiritimatiellaceae bacterium]HBO87175.1 potassium transporter [Verrucomicrobiota bacterium]
MNRRAVFQLVSYLTLVIGVAMVGCAGISIYYNEPVTFRYSFLFAGGLAVIFALLLRWVTRGSVNLSRRDGFGVVTFGWLTVTVFGSLPYLFSGIISHPISALFETMSGFTTTGATVLSNLESIPHSIHFWRHLTQWLGGMGVLILCIAILPFLGVGGMQVFRAEMTGPSKDRLTPRITTTAKLLWGVYILISISEVILLHFVGKMGWFDAVCHTFSTVATGGFSTRSGSIGAFNSSSIEIIIMSFMFICGINFQLHYLALIGKPSGYLKNSELKFYISLILIVISIVTISIYISNNGNIFTCLKNAAFTSISLITGTGYVTADYDKWPNAIRILLVAMMFFGGCAGSTTGSMKIMRINIILKSMLREIKTFMRPSAVIQTKMDGKSIEPMIVAQVGAFFSIFVLIFALGSFIMTFFTPNLETAATSVIATLGNIGPGLNAVGATQNYASIPVAGQGFLTFLMLLGRLELYTVLILFLPSFWKR